MSDEKRAHYEPDEVIRSQGGKGLEFDEVVARRLTRRDAMRQAFGSAIALGLAGCVPQASQANEKETPVITTAGKKPGGLNFESLRDVDQSTLQVAAGYSASVLLSYGDPLEKDGGAFDFQQQSRVEAARRFGYNNDFVGFLPLPFGSENSEHGLLGVNHEYTSPELMFPGADPKKPTKPQAEVMLEAMGFSVSEVKRTDGEWSLVKGSNFNRRVTGTSPIQISGPARGHKLMQTKADPKGEVISGTFANCSAGKTPWGTVLSGEENFQDYFANGASLDASLQAARNRYGVPNEGSQYGFDLHDDRFDAAKEPNENHRFGWVVEVDLYDPAWQPRKRTALGRFRHEAATTFVTKENRLVMYSGDDARFEYVYKFVASKPFNSSNREANRDLLDEGVLYVAKYNEDGTGEWMPLIHGQGPLTSENGFENQGDVVINVRLAADLLGATKMDRPEDIEVNPVNKKVYVACTNNTDRGQGGKAGADKPNPRDRNEHGHIVEMTEKDDDHAALTFTWELFLVCGDPKDEATYFAGYAKNDVVPISCPDNLTFDKFGNLWIATDGQPKTIEVNDGLYGVATDGPERGKLKPFFSTVPGAEVCGPEFTPDNTTLFVAIQHPGEGSSFEKPSTSWPGTSGPPRPAVIAIRRDDGQPIGA